MNDNMILCYVFEQQRKWKKILWISNSIQFDGWFIGISFDFDIDSRYQQTIEAITTIPHTVLQYQWKSIDDEK